MGGKLHKLHKGFSVMSFCIIFEKKYYSCYIQFTDQILLSDCLRDILGNMCIVIIC